MSGIKSRRKGNRFELALVQLLQGAGLGAEKTSRTGYSGGDLSVPLLGHTLIIEAKSRAKGFSKIYTWLQNRDILIVKSDRKDAIVILPLKLAAEIAAAAEKSSRALVSS
jgi:Holliday junction resolvase